MELVYGRTVSARLELLEMRNSPKQIKKKEERGFGLVGDKYILREKYIVVVWGYEKEILGNSQWGGGSV